MTRILVLGGYGLFGQRISARLSQSPGFHVGVAGRNAAQAEAHIASFDPAARERSEAVAIDTTSPDFEHALRTFAPDIVIDTAGPFQARELRVPRAALACGAHCVDLADGRDYVARIKSLDAEAKAAGRRVITGASSVPGLSSAVVDAFAQEFHAIKQIEAGINPGNHTPRGLATTRAILSYVGKAYPILKDGAWTPVHGWQSLKQVTIGDTGARWFARCEVPDLDVLPERFPSIESCDFRAGLELKRMHFGLWLASWAVRAGLVRSMARWAEPLLRISERWQRAGTDTGVMYMDLRGRSPDGADTTMRWEIIARDGDGPQIPATPAVVLAGKLARGEITGGGASACTGFFSLEDCMASLAPFAIETRVLRNPPR